MSPSALPLSPWNGTGVHKQSRRGLRVDDREPTRDGPTRSTRATGRISTPTMSKPILQGPQMSTCAHLSEGGPERNWGQGASRKTCGRCSGAHPKTIPELAIHGRCCARHGNGNQEKRNTAQTLSRREGSCKEPEGGPLGQNPTHSYASGVTEKHVRSFLVTSV